MVYTLDNPTKYTTVTEFDQSTLLPFMVSIVLCLFKFRCYCDWPAIFNKQSRIQNEASE